MNLEAPTPLVLTHQALLAEVKAAAKLDGRTGKAARLVARLLPPHYAKEEEFALVPLGLLPALAQGEIEPQMAAAITRAKRLHEELSDLLAERRAIAAAVEELAAAAEADGHAELVGLAERLLLHEETKEQVWYPTAILVGKFLQLRLKV